MGYEINEVLGNRIVRQPGGLGLRLLTSIGYDKYSIEKIKKNDIILKFYFRKKNLLTMCQNGAGRNWN